MPDDSPHESPTPAHDERKLFVTKIPASVSEDEIRDVFSTYGRVVAAQLESAYVDGRGTRSAFITFDIAEDALAAMMVLNDMYAFGVETVQPIVVKVAGAGPSPSEARGVELDARRSAAPAVGPPAAHGTAGVSRGLEDQPGRVSSSEAKGHGRFDGKGKTDAQGPGGGDAYKLFAGSLPADVSREEIQAGFGVYGGVVDVFIMAGKSKSGQACAFITLSSTTEVDACVVAMNGGYELRRGAGPIEVKRFTDKPSRLASAWTESRSNDGRGGDGRSSDGRNGDGWSGDNGTSNWRDSGNGADSWSGGKDSYNGKDSYGKGYGKDSYSGKDSYGPYGGRDYGGSYGRAKDSAGKGSYGGQEWWGGKDSYGKEKTYGGRDYGGKDSYGKDSYGSRGGSGSYGGKDSYGSKSGGGFGGGYGEGGGRSGGGGKGSRQVCPQFQRGRCAYGANCRYYHE